MWDLGHYPMESTNRGRGERHLAERLRRALNDGKLSSEHVGTTEQKVEYNRAVHQVAALQVDELMQGVRELGRYPKRPSGDKVEWKLALDVFTARRAKQFSPEQEAELEALQQAERQAIEAARIAAAEELTQEVRSLGFYPKEGLTRSPAEQHVAEKLRKTWTAKQFSGEKEAELKALRQAERRKNWDEEGEKLMRQVRDLGRYPMESTNRSLTERLLAERLSRALNGGKLSPEFVAELQVLRQAGAEEKTEEKMQEVRGGSRYPMESRHDPNERQEADKPPAKKHKGTPDDSWQEGTIPVTIRMILDAHDCYGGSVGTLIVNGRGASMCMLVAQVVEKALKPDMPGRLILDDASGRIPVEVYRDQGQMTDEDELPRVGEYVRVVGTLSSCSERVQLTCRFIERLVNDSEIPYHLIEVAHASLKLRLAEKLAMTRDKENTVNSSLPRDRSNISVVGPSDHWLHKDRSVPAP